jgi:hypothetical protein
LHHLLHPPAQPKDAEHAIGVATTDGTLVGVVIVGRPEAQAFDDGCTVEVIRLSTDGTPKAYITLLAAAWRDAKAAGYRRMVTYALTSDPGTSLRAAGFRHAPNRPTRPDWHIPSRSKSSHGTDGVTRILWEITVTRFSRRRRSSTGGGEGE